MQKSTQSHRTASSEGDGRLLWVGVARLSSTCDGPLVGSILEVVTSIEWSRSGLDGWCLHLIMMVSRVCPLCAARSLPVGAVGGGSATLPMLLALLPELLLVEVAGSIEWR